MGRVPLVVGASAAAVTAVLLACAGPQTKEERLHEELARFHHHLMAGDVDQAAAMVSPGAMEAFTALHDPARTIFRAEDFNVVSMVRDPVTKRITVVVTADTRKENSITVRTVRLREVWGEQGGRWVLLSEEVLSPAR